jgi:hypothetical protein
MHFNMLAGTHRVLPPEHAHCAAIPFAYRCLAASQIVVFGNRKEGGSLFGVVVDPNGLQVLKIQIISFKDAAAIEAFNVIYAVSPRQNFDSFVLANNGLHKETIRFILAIAISLSRRKCDFSEHLRAGIVPGELG